MKITEKYEIQVCGLCLLAHEAPNAGTYTDDEERKAMNNWAVNWPGFSFVSTEDEGGFAWSACDGCGDSLGGHRYQAFAVEYGVEA